MAPEDYEGLTMKHATSKLSAFSDLASVSCLILYSPIFLPSPSLLHHYFILFYMYFYIENLRYHLMGSEERPSVLYVRYRGWWLPRGLQHVR